MNEEALKRPPSCELARWSSLVRTLVTWAVLGLTTFAASAQALTVRFPAGSNGRVIDPSEIEPGDIVRIAVDVELPPGAACADYLVVVGSSESPTSRISAPMSPIRSRPTPTGMGSAMYATRTATTTG